MADAYIEKGTTYEIDGKVYECLEFLHVKPGKGQAFVRTKLRNLRTGTTTEYSFNAGEKLEQAMIEKKKMQYLYGGSEYCFMDMETYEQVEIPAERLQWESKFLLESMIVEIVFYGDEILGINLPEKVSLEVTEASPAVAGNTATNALKEVTTETGLVVKVPMFIEQGDHIIVSTWDGKYNSRG
mgnify:CR=1 FL=1